MKKIFSSFLFLICLVSLGSSWQEEKSKGNFEKAGKMIDQILSSPSGSLEQKQKLEVEKEVMRRIRKDFSLTKEALVDELKENVKNFDASEFEKWEQEKRLQSLVVDGQRMYFSSNVSNLFFRYPDIRARKKDGPDSQLLEDLINAVKKVNREARGKEILPFGIRRTIQFQLAVKSVLKIGDNVAVWMPFPQSLPWQTNIHLVSDSSGLELISPFDASMRTAFFSRKYLGDGDQLFSLSLVLDTYARHHRVDSSRVISINPERPDLSYFLKERAPHVVFIPEIKDAVKAIVKDEVNPAKKARAIYDWFGENLVYSYAYEYSTMENISRFTFENRYGDCGQLALLYITMCRIAGIPARWQSGWMLYPSNVGMHDWTEIYLEPYGWVPVDPWVPVTFRSNDCNADPSIISETVNFYFGNMDPGRYYLNRDHGCDFIPSKKDFRSDDVDSQRGEIEVNGKNVYFGDFSYKLKILEESEISQ